MALNFVRGFRRIGWVITFPLAALIVLVFYEDTKEFSPVNYEVAQSVDYDTLAKQLGGKAEPPPTLPADFFEGGGPYVVELSGIGTASFSGTVPKDVAEKTLSDFKAKYKRSAAVKPWDLDWSRLPPLPRGFFLADDSVPICWNFTVHKRASKVKLAGLIAGSVLIPALIIQGSISVLAWVFRGFKGSQ